MQKRDVGIAAIVLTGAWLLLWWLLVPAHTMYIVYNTPVTDASDAYPLFPSGKPWGRAQEGEVAGYVLKLHLAHAYQMQHFRILPDDCVQGILVNGKPLPGLELPHCNYSEGLGISLAGHLQKGENTVIITIKNYQSTVGLDFYVDPASNMTGRFLLSVGLVCLGFWLWLACRAFQLPPAAMAAFFLMNALILYGGFHYTYRSFSHDLGAHLDHIAHLYTRWWRLDPFAHAGFRYPSTVHLLQALVLKATSPLLVGGLALRAFSYICYVGFLLVGAHLIAKALAHKKAMAVVAQVLFLLWPLHAIVALRVSNDVPFYLALAVALLCWLRLWEKVKFNRLAYAVMALAIATLIKYNALALLPMVCWVLWAKRKALLALFDRGVLLQNRLLACMALVVTFGALYLGPVYSLQKAAEMPYNPGIFGAHGFGGAGLFGKNDANALGLPTDRNLFDHPFINHAALEEKQNIWQYMLATALFGEFGFEMHVVTARLMVLGLLLMLLSVLPWLFCLKRNFPAQQPVLWLHLLFLMGSVVALCGFRMLYQQTAAMDFRYIVPCLISLVLLWQQSVAFWWQRGLLVLPVLSISGALLVICGGFFLYSAYFYGLS